MPELQVNLLLITHLCNSLQTTIERLDDSPVSTAALLLMLQAKRFQQSVIDTMPSIVEGHR